MAPPIPAALSKIFWATQMQIPALKSFRLIKGFVAFFLLFPFSVPRILNHQDLLMSNKHKNASLSSFAAKARMIIKLNPGHMALVLLLGTSPGLALKGELTLGRKTGETGMFHHRSLCRGEGNRWPQSHRVVGHTQDWRHFSYMKELPLEACPQHWMESGKGGAEGQRRGKVEVT